MITYRMLPRQLTLPRPLPARLTPLPSYSCSLLALFFPRPSFRINHLQPLFAEHPGGGYIGIHPVSFALAIVCATQRLYPHWSQPVAHTSRYHGVSVPFRSSPATLALVSGVSHIRKLLWPNSEALNNTQN